MILTTTELERRNTLFQPRMNRQLLFGSLNPPSNVTPDTIYQYLLEYYGFDDTSRVYSNLWAQQIAERGNSWENFYNYFSRMGLSPKPVQASAPEPFYTEDNEMAVGGMVMNRWKQLGVHNDYYVLSPMYEKARSMGYQAFVDYFNSISDAEFLRDSGLPAGVDWSQPKPSVQQQSAPEPDPSYLWRRQAIEPATTPTPTPEPFYTEDNEMAVGGMVMNRWKQLGVHDDYYVLSPMYEKARSMGYQAFVNYFNSISDAEFLRDSGLPAGVDWTQPKPTTVKKKQPNLLPYIIAGVAIASQIF